MFNSITGLWMTLLVYQLLFVWVAVFIESNLLKWWLEWDEAGEYVLEVNIFTFIIYWGIVFCLPFTTSLRLFQSVLQTFFFAEITGRQLLNTLVFLLGQSAVNGLFKWSILNLILSFLEDKTLQKSQGVILWAIIATTTVSTLTFALLLIFFKAYTNSP